MHLNSILVIDDDMSVRDFLGDFLTGSGYKVTTVEDPNVGLQRLRDNMFDLVITDLMMPEMSGIDLLKAARSYDQDLPIVMITGYPSIDVAIKAMKEGADDFITKPFNFDHTKIVIKRAVEEGKLRKQNKALVDRLEETGKLKSISRKMQGKLKELSALYTISESLHFPFLTTAELFERILELATTITEAKKASIWMLDKRSEKILLKSEKGMAESIGNFFPASNVGLVNNVFSEKKYALSQDCRDCVCVNGDVDFKHPSLCVPIMIGGDVFAALQICQKLGDTDFTKDDTTIMTTLAQKASLRIENLALYENLISNMFQGVTSLVKAIDAKDNYTMNHCKRVTLYAVKLAEGLSCSGDMINALKFAGPIHDVGKIGIRDDVLLKPGILQPDERSIMERHVIIGDDIITPLNLGHLEHAIVRYHHEKFDGTGYPDGLTGDEIPLVARIFSVADTFDAMTSNRPYRSARSHEKAVEELIRCSNYQFDRDVVDVFVESCVS